MLDVQIHLHTLVNHAVKACVAAVSWTVLLSLG
jgi:hypothetical protein